MLDSPIVSHLIQKLESTKENISFVRVDSDHVDNLIKKDETMVSKLSEDEKTALDTVLKEVVPSDKFMVQLEAMDSNSAPFMITQPEFMRRMKEMQQTGGGGMFGMGNMPEMYNLVINTNSELATSILNANTDDVKASLVKQGLDLANKGWKQACKEDNSLKLGLNIINGKVVYKAISEAFNLKYSNLNELI